MRKRVLEDGDEEAVQCQWGRRKTVESETEIDNGGGF